MRSAWHEFLGNLSKAPFVALLYEATLKLILAYAAARSPSAVRRLSLSRIIQSASAASSTLASGPHGRRLMIRLLWINSRSERGGYRYAALCGQNSRSSKIKNLLLIITVQPIASAITRPNPSQRYSDITTSAALYDSATIWAIEAPL